MPPTKNQKDISNVDELDKFKRRMIRSLARSLIHEKKPEDEVWEMMKKETGCGCNMLWQRMRILTLKKLKRLYAADDKIKNVPTVARMTQTDWLLFDLIVVHEKIDFIDKDQMTLPSKDREPLIDLFALVMQFDIENRSGESLAEAWTAAAVLYNSKGHQCSPMLLQKRWYQLKEVTRQLFYNYWFAYRGNSRLLAKAEENKPTKLLREIAQKYPNIITSPFVEWQELIEKRLIILSEEFETKKWMNSPKTLLAPESIQDVEIIEPVIETIELDQDSESETDNKKRDEENVQTDKKIIEVKLEPKESEQEDVIKVETHKLPLAIHSVETETTLLDSENSYSDKNSGKYKNDLQTYDDPPEATVNLSEVTEQRLKLNVNPPEVTEELPDRIEDPPDTSVDFNARNDIEICDKGAPKIVQVFGNVDLSSQILNMNDAIIDIDAQTGEEPYISTAERIDLPGEQEEHGDDNINDESRNIIRIDADDKLKSEEPLKPLKVVDGKSQKFDNVVVSEPKIENDNDLNATGKIVQGLDVLSKPEIHDRLHFDFFENGIELVDDGIEYIEENHTSTVTASIPIKTEADNKPPNCEDEDGTTKFDYKLLMDPVVYTTRVDEMDTLKDKSYQSVKDKSLIQLIIAESKPICKPIENVNKVNLNNTSVREAINDDSLIEQETNAVSGSEDEIDDSFKVKISSYLLKKPRNRSYNPIKLCKNPDFNTRLKRLTVAFLSSPRNRALLKACKPMTIDVMKAFESKLVNGTMFLKDCDQFIPNVRNEDTNHRTLSIAPSTMAIQSLIDNSMTESKSSSPNTTPVACDDTIERNKIINLPDITEVRRINQRLLTAEVPPIRVQTSNTMRVGSEIVPNTEAISKEITSIKVEVNSEVVLVDKPTEKIKKFEDPVIDLPEGTNMFLNNQEQECSFADTRVEAYSQLTCQEMQKTKKKKKDTAVSKSWRPVTSSRVSWLKNYVKTDYESLLTLDTLNKMLIVMNEGEFFNKYSTTNNVKINKKQNNEKGADNPKAISNSREMPWKPKFCCWARYRIDSMLNNKTRRNNRHHCEKDDCICCCKSALNLLIEDAIRAAEHDKLKKTVYDIGGAVKKSQESIPNKKIITRIIPRDEQNHKTPIKDIQAADPDHGDIETINSAEKEIQSIVPAQEEIKSINTDQNNPNKQNKPTSVALLSEHNYSTTDESTPNLIDDKGSYVHKQPDNCFKIVLQTHNEETVRKPKSSLKTLVIEPIINNMPNESQKPMLMASVGSQQTSDKQKNANEKPCLIVKDNIKLPPAASAKKFNTLKKYGKCTIDPKRHVSNRKFLLNIPNGKAIKLGQKTIMVTNIKLPIESKSYNSTCQEKSEQESGNDGPAQTLPEGVQLVLLPNGELIASVEPGTVVDAKQISSIPIIMESIQKQLIDIGICPTTSNTASTSTASSKNTSDATINVSDQSSEVLEETVILNREEPQIDKTDDNILTTDSIIGPLPGIDRGVESYVTSDANDSCKELEKRAESSNLNTSVGNSQNVDVPAPKPERSSLLSDLMEMSGISTEDTISASEPISDSTQHAVPPLSAINTIPDLVPHVSETPLFVTDPADYSPVTSYVELKYAVQNNASFFSYNCSTGVILPINVSLGKNPLKATKEIIDLTDENDDSITDAIHKPADSITKYQLVQDSKFKSLKLIKPLVQYRSKRQRLIPKKNVFKQNILYNRLKQQELNDEPAKIDLVDSDYSMEEEYLEDSDNDEEQNVTTSEATDSSDDEPLSKKVKLNKSCSSVPVYMDEKTTKNHQIDVSTNIVSDTKEAVSCLSEEVTKNIEVSDNVDPAPEFFTSDCSDDEICILGV
ncbi:uncharacterized protein LOC101743023 [Bombyx mori]|uniref:Uncharacterized protein n=1 Tax=Bombyx mori TaxID=7091 RepID=A0A8R2G7Q0_BOMMO|nr:uncharacterized protein LOC101743023 [Bombyx mori]